MDYSKYIFPSDGTMRLSDFKTDDKNSFGSQNSADEALHQGVERLSEIQDILYAQDKFSLLIILHQFLLLFSGVELACLGFVGLHM